MEQGEAVRERRRLFEAKLRADLELAKSRYFAARAEDERAAELFRDLDETPADAHFALRKATAIASRLRREYAQVLAEFTRFILQGVVPERLKLGSEEPTGQARRAASGAE